MCFFKKKTPREWTFGDKPYVLWGAKNTVKYGDMTTFIKIALTQIQGINDISLVVINNDKMISKFNSNDIEMQAILQAIPEKHQYKLIIHSRVGAGSIASIVCHEIIHLTQYERGDLRQVKDGVMWKGKFYSEDIPYMERPWEQEANGNMYKLEKKVKDLYYEK